MARKLKLDSRGIAEVLRRAEVADAVESLGQSVKGNVGSPTASGKPVDVTTRSRTAAGGRLSARPAVDITLAHPAGLAIEAKRGYLVKAASAAGLEVKRRRK